MIAAKSPSITVHPHSEIPALYEAMYSDIFGEIDPTHKPATILIGSLEDKVVWMMAVYIHDLVTVYIQASGLVSSQRPSPNALRWLTESVEFLHRNARHIPASVDNKNGRAIRLLLKAGFIITGTRLAPDGSLLVDVRHTKENEHGAL